MSEFGYKIKNYEANSIYSYNLGIAHYYKTKDAMLTNSLFSEVLLELGMDVYKGESTRDIICIEFDKTKGVRDFHDEMTHWDRFEAKVVANKGEIYSPKQQNELIAYCAKMRENAENNKEKFKKIDGDEIREEFYINGVDIFYPIWKGRGKNSYIADYDKIHYVSLYRTPGKAKKGSCMFIREELYEPARNYLWMGLTLPYDNCPIVEIGAYSSLFTSTIIGKVHIDPDEILVIKDVESVFHTNVVSIETNSSRHCVAKRLSDYPVINTMYDGQALVDSSIFPEWGDGYILLRHHFCKMAAFNTNIQKFMREKFGSEYETAELTDIYGLKHKVSRIKLITTENAMKWMKFDVSYQYWSDWVRKNGAMFGIVKTAHESKLGHVQRMSYQMVNVLDMNSMPNVLSTSLKYIKELQTNDESFLNYLRQNSNFSNDHEVLLALVEQNHDFIYTDYFRDRRRKIIEAYTLNLKTGKVIQNADNLVIVGSPYAMLLSSVGDDPFTDPTFETEEGTIQCFTNRFEDGEYLAEFRNPFNSRNNLGFLHNHYHEYFFKYFDFGNLIIAVNMINTDFQDRNNGSDQDSDSIYVTNQDDIVLHAKYCYDNYPTIVNNIPKEKNEYKNTVKTFARIDNNLAAYQKIIGESSNLAQICLTYTYNFNDAKYIDYTCILAVLAQVAIDSTKRKFDIDLQEELRRIKIDMETGKNGYPEFWALIRRGFNRKRINEDLICPMNSLCSIKRNHYPRKEKTIPVSEFFVKYEFNNVGAEHRRAKKAESMIEKYSIMLGNQRNNNPDDSDDFILLNVLFDELVEDLRSITFTSGMIGFMSWLINRAFIMGSGAKANNKSGKTMSTMLKNKSLLLKILYDVNPQMLLKCFDGYEKV